MRKRLLNILICPNNHKNDLKLFGSEVYRNGVLITNITHDQILDDDDVAKGMIICESSNTAYPISEYIAILLSDNDLDIKHYQPLLEFFIDKCPDPYHRVLLETIKRIRKISETTEGRWNREEMRYYDSEVNSPEQRNAMLHEIKKVPIWRIFIPRIKHIINFITNNCKGQNILEIGCGNSRTVSWAFNPSIFHYNYIGTDISFKRLLVAKKSIPEGDFLQASALNLPFKEKSFYTVISFGMLHHLPRPDHAIKICSPLIINEGYFVFHEPIIRPEIHLPGVSTFKKVMTDYEHSEHDGKINLDETLSLFRELGFSTVNLAKEISIIRSFTETIIKRISRNIMKKKAVINTLTAADSLVLATVGKLSKRAGPSAIFAVMKKTKQ